MNVPLTPTFQIPLVALSYFFAVVGSLIALTAARRIVGKDGRVSYSVAAVAGVALGGVGVWSMHFIGMLALELDMGVSYAGVETLASLVAAVVATSAALTYVAKAPTRWSRILLAGTLLGMGVVVMHYLGMHGMRFGGFIRWDWNIVGLSILIAVVAANAALWLAFNTRNWLARSSSALVMGLAVCAMHYTGMAAATFICTTANRNAIPDGFGFISALQLPAWVTMVTAAVALLLAFDLILRRMIEAAERPSRAR